MFRVQCVELTHMFFWCFHEPPKIYQLILVTSIVIPQLQPHIDEFIENRSLFIKVKQIPSKNHFFRRLHLHVSRLFLMCKKSWWISTYVSSLNSRLYLSLKIQTTFQLCHEQCFPCIMVKIPPFSHHFPAIVSYFHMFRHVCTVIVIVSPHFCYYIHIGKIHITISVLLLFTINSNMIIFCTIIFVLLLFTITITIHRCLVLLLLLFLYYSYYYYITITIGNITITACSPHFFPVVHHPPRAFGNTSSLSCAASLRSLEATDWRKAFSTQLLGNGWSTRNSYVIVIDVDGD